MRLVFNVVMLAVALAVVSVFALRMAQVFKPAEVHQGIVEKASDVFDQGYTSAEIFVLDARYQLKHNKLIKILGDKAWAIKEKITAENGKSADDLKKITPGSIPETFK